EEQDGQGGRDGLTPRPTAAHTKTPLGNAERRFSFIVASSPCDSERRQLRAATLAVPLGRIVHRAALATFERLRRLGGLVLDHDRNVARHIRRQRSAPTR